MGDAPAHSEVGESPARPNDRAELRTIAFRMREMQRLLAIRVEQENRRLEADGIEPVSEREPVHESRFLESTTDD